MSAKGNSAELLPGTFFWFQTAGELLELSGTDVLSFLHRMSTAEIAGLPLGQGRATVFVTEKGRIKDVGIVLHREPGNVEVFCSAGAGEELLAWLRRFRVLDDVRFHPPQRWGGAELHGAPSKELLTALGLPRVTPVHWGAGYAGEWRGYPLRCFRVPAFIPDSAYRLLVPEERSAQLWEALRECAGEPLTSEQVEALRIAAGHGRHGTEWTEEYNPWEAGLTELVSLTKGCYVGQEVIARLSTYDKVQRQLVRLYSPSSLSAPAPLFASQRQVGILTSAAFDPWRRQWIALGYLRREWVWTQEFQLETAPGVWVPIYRWDRNS